MLTTHSFSVYEALTKRQAARARCWVVGGNQTKSLLSRNSQALSLFFQARKRARTQFIRGSTGHRRGIQSLRYSNTWCPQHREPCLLWWSRASGSIRDFLHSRHSPKPSKCQILLQQAVSSGENGSTSEVRKPSSST